MTDCAHPDAIDLKDTNGAVVRRYCTDCTQAPEPEPAAASTAHQFRARPDLVEAMQFDGTNAWAITEWAQGTGARIRCWPVGPQLWVDTPGRVTHAQIGDWLLREHDHLRVVTNEMFARTHDPAE